MSAHYPLIAPGHVAVWFENVARTALPTSAGTQTSGIEPATIVVRRAV